MSKVNEQPTSEDFSIVYFEMLRTSLVKMISDIDEAIKTLERRKEGT